MLSARLAQRTGFSLDRLQFNAKRVYGAFITFALKRKLHAKTRPGALRHPGIFYSAPRNRGRYRRRARKRHRR